MREGKEEPNSRMSIIILLFLGLADALDENVDEKFDEVEISSFDNDESLVKSSKDITRFVAFRDSSSKAFLSRRIASVYLCSSTLSAYIKK